MDRSAQHVPLVVNRIAGLGHAGGAESQIVRCLASLHCDVRVVPTTSGPQAAEVCARLREECDRILLAGGDGTVNSVLPALAGSGVALGLLPVGMANVLARELGIPLSIEGMCRVAAGGNVRSIDLGCANGRPFALMAGIGFDAQVIHALNPRLKRFLGPTAYVMTALRLAPRSVAARVEVTYEGGRRELDLWLAVVANASTYTYRWKAVPGADLADGLLDLCAFRCCGPMKTFGQVVAGVRGRHAQHPEVLLMRAASFTLTATPPLPVQVDGDAAGATPVTVTTLPGALRILVP